MKKLIIATALLMPALGMVAKPQPENPDSTGFTFTDVKVVKTGSVKDQNKSGTCWCFAGTSFLEDEINKKTGKELDLSEMYTVRQCYLDKAEKYMRMDGKINFAQGGSILDVPYSWRRYGMMPEDAYQGLNYGEDKHNHYELAAALEGYLDGVLQNLKKNKKLSTAWHKGVEGILDAYLGPVPETFKVDGVTYTPASYAKSLGLDMDDYVAVASFTHHPFYSPFILEVADNWIWGEYQNVPLDELKAIVDNAIENGYSIEWAADVSEPGFKWQKGYALLPEPKDASDMDGTELSRWVKLSDKDRDAEKFEFNGPCKEQKVTQESRQKAFDNYETTDDHGMVIVGIATDQEGNRYYKVKNSWDTNQIYDGFFYVSEPYFLAKTIGVLVNKNAIPKKIASKMKL